MTIKVLPKQTIYDIAILATGTAEHAYAIARANEMQLHEPLTIGTLLIIPTNLKRDSKVLNYYKQRGLIPATAPTANNMVAFGFPEGEFPISL